MALRDASDWIWDCWTADDGEQFHLFFLCASRELTPDERHFHARVGHAVSDDLFTWERLADAVVPGANGPDGYDTRAVWTGSVHRTGPEWLMFRTGLRADEPGPVQRVGCDRSADLTHWRPVTGDGWPLRADPRWYEQSATDEHWRDPWIAVDTDGLWHMYLTARVPASGSVQGGRGVVGHATSHDLAEWQVQPPLGTPGRFEQIEVIQTARIDERWVLVFSCLGPEMYPPQPGHGGIWWVEIEGPGSPVDLERATLLTDERLYAGRLVRDRNGTWNLLAFVNQDDTIGEHHEFGGWITDPLPVYWGEQGLLVSPQPFTTDRPARTCR